MCVERFDACDILLAYTVHGSHDTNFFFSFGVDGQGNEVYGGGDGSVGIFLHRSSDDAVVKGDELRLREPCDTPRLCAAYSRIGDIVFWGLTLRSTLHRKGIYENIAILVRVLNISAGDILYRLYGSLVGGFVPTSGRESTSC